MWTAPEALVRLGDDQAGVAGEIRGQGLATAWRLARSRPVANAAAGREPPSPSPANPFLMELPPGRPRLVHGRRAAPPRSPETSLSDEWSI